MLRASTNTERDEHRQVGGRERVEHHLGEEVGIQLGGPVGQRTIATSAAMSRIDAEQDEARVVAEGPALGAGRAARRAGSVGRVASRVSAMVA